MENGIMPLYSARARFSIIIFHTRNHMYPAMRADSSQSAPNNIECVTEFTIYAQRTFHVTRR